MGGVRVGLLGRPWQGAGAVLVVHQALLQEHLDNP